MVPACGRPSGVVSDPRYNTARWRCIRARQLTEHPYCRYCQDAGRVSIATVADHIVPHRGDAQLFWDTSNLQSLCAPCHSATKQAQENVQEATGLDGWPEE